MKPQILVAGLSVCLIVCETVADHELEHSIAPLLHCSLYAVLLQFTCPLCLLHSAFTCLLLSLMQLQLSLFLFCENQETRIRERKKIHLQVLFRNVILLETYKYYGSGYVSK